MNLHLYLLEAIDTHPAWDPWYDKAYGFVVRATSPEQARQLAANRCGDEGPGVWSDETATTCYPLTAEGGTFGVVLRDFHHA